jgi:L-ribulose-5-phosphate 4-epimerase
VSDETGAVKFTCEQIAIGTPRFAEFDELNRYRRGLVDLGLIGVDANGIGFGNISVRDGDTAQFFVTGSGTGKLEPLTPADCARVVAYDFEKNWLRCEGKTVASSESLTHAAVYETDPTIKAVIHVHDVRLWRAVLDKIPTTPPEIKYGTSEMARAVQRLFRLTDLKTKKLFAMAGHGGGIVAFGKDLSESFAVLNKIR